FATDVRDPVAFFDGNLGRARARRWAGRRAAGGRIATDGVIAATDHGCVIGAALERVENVHDRICRRAGVVPAKEQTQWPRRVGGYHQRTGVAAGTEAASVNDDLVAEGRGEGLRAAAGGAVIHRNGGDNRLQRRAGEAAGATTLGDALVVREHIE